MAWSNAQHRKFRKTMAAKHATKKTTAVIPLEAIPDRRPPAALRVPTEKHARLALAMALVKTVQELIK